MRAQSRLLGSVLWWYLLPGFIGLLVMTWGSLPIHDPVKLWVMLPTNIVVTLFFIGVDVFIYRLNQRARVKQLLPPEAQLESLIHSAETGEPLDEQQVGNLHSLSLADQRIRRKVTHALDFSGTTFRPEGGRGQLCPRKPPNS